MSKFEVKVTKISEINEHPNADRLVVSKVEGMNWQFCSQKGLYEVGTPVVYFPVDSRMPSDLAEHLGIKQYLAGKDHDRLKTVKLRGQISQGLVIAEQTIRDFVESKTPGTEWPPPNLTEALGITKWESPGIECFGATLQSLPDGVSMYDLEGADNYPGVVEVLMDQKVLVSEKLEGTNFSVTIQPHGEVLVNQRNYTIVPDLNAVKEHTFWEIARARGYIDAVKRLQEKAFPNQQVTLRGEFVGPGIQDNIYKIKEKEVRFFDVLVDFKYLPVDTFLDVAAVFGLKTVPILSDTALPPTLREWLAGKSLQEASNGESIFGDAKVAREGIVIKPFQEANHPEIGRLIIKQRSPEYLAKTDM